METTLITLGALIAADAWALWSIAGADASIARRAAWAAFVIGLPVIGFLGWSLFGPRRARSGPSSLT
ncbi:PLDc_N domain-containing protein [Jannaschia sp. Os4]|uniref:PLD nuclease N-terminal domain-containing protein n=1 Tax=Jannaschia sp. Os4 TaxID=2807617 RepID=UPI0019394B14|nr:PLD nuclease N-terminal domain-containing protein [Jannaschia sp. Os4]MBM2574894.1 PLDc_N domain-containing protein [Jannaschia sp. Os4]